MNTLLFFLHIAIVVVLIYRLKSLRITGVPRNISIALFVLKCLIGSFVYSYYTGLDDPGDAVSYIHDARLIFQMLLDAPCETLYFIFNGGPLPVGYANVNFNLWNSITYLPFFNDTRTVILVNVIISAVSMGLPDIHLVWMNLIAWTGMCLIGRAIFSNKVESLIVLVPFLVPQILLWTSLVLKESLLLLCLGLLFFGLSQLPNHHRNGLKYILTGLMGFLFVKTFLLILIMPGIIAYLIALKWKKLAAWKIFGGVLTMLCAMLILLSKYFTQFDIPALLYGQQLSMYRYAVYNGAGSIIKPIMLAPSWTSFIKRIPESIFYALVQPVPWLYHVKYAWLVFMENCFVLFIIVFRLYKSRKSIINNPYSLMLLTGGLAILAVSGFVTPVAGSLVRYKVPGVLLLMLGVFNTFNLHRKRRHNLIDLS